MNPIIKVSTHRWKWMEFTLQAGHYYGHDEKGPFVTSDKSDESYMVLYRPIEHGNFIQWRKVTESGSNRTVKAIRAFQCKRFMTFDQPQEIIRADRSRQRITPPIPIQKRPMTWVDAMCGLV